MTSILGKTQLQRLLKNQQPVSRQQAPFRQVRSDSIYNLKDFLPSTSNINIQNRLKAKSTINQSQVALKNKSSNLISPNVEQKLIEQKMNKLKQQNLQLQKVVDEQKFFIKSQGQQIAELRKQIQKLRLAEQKKFERLSMWSYKYHIEYTPKQRHKYSLAVQTEDIYTSRTQVSGNLRARDFEDIYRRLNTNQSTVEVGTKKTRKQSNSMKSTMNFTVTNPKTVESNSTIKITKVIEENKSLFNFHKKQDLVQKQNKENLMYISNINFSRNPMDINMSKIQAQQKPIKEQCLQIYPVEEEDLDSIVGELLCGNDN